VWEQQRYSAYQHLLTKIPMNYQIQKKPVLNRPSPRPPPDPTCPCAVHPQEIAVRHAQHHNPRSAGLTIWQKRHMPRAARFWGPRASLFYFFLNFLFPVSARGPNSAPVRGPKEPKSPRKRYRPPKFKNRGPKVRGPKRFFCSLF
jgi:hypothetical protein